MVSINEMLVRDGAISDNENDVDEQFEGNGNDPVEPDLGTGFYWPAQETLGGTFDLVHFHFLRAL